MPTLTYQGLKYSSGKAVRVDDALALEQAIQITINNEAFSITMCSPRNEKELVRGLLFSEDIYKNKKVNPEIEIVEKSEKGFPLVVNVSIDASQLSSRYLNSRSLLSVSSCGICGKVELQELKGDAIPFPENEFLNAELIPDMFDKMNTGQHTFRQSGGSHAAAAFDLKGNMLSIQEDIGRHNAVDKVIGDLLFNNILSDAKCLLVSGRISYEIVSKAFTAGIPFLAAVSAPSTLAVDFAKELGITLLAFCRKKQFTVYAHSNRIKGVLE